jgi:hypothetical protein
MEALPQLKHPPLFEITGADIPSAEVNRRLELYFKEFPRFQKEYAMQTSKYLDQGTLDAAVLGKILRNYGLRDFVFLEWNTEYFNENFNEDIRIARERGSYDQFLG